MIDLIRFDKPNNNVSQSTLSFIYFLLTFSLLISHVPQVEKNGFSRSKIYSENIYIYIYQNIFGPEQEDGRERDGTGKECRCPLGRMRTTDIMIIQL